MSRVAAPVVAGLLTGFLFILVFSTYVRGSLDSKPSHPRENTWLNANGGIACSQPIEIVKARASFPVPLPALLPSGYCLQYANYSGVKEVFMEYYNATICGRAGPKSLRGGTMEIRTAPFDERITGAASNAMNGTQYTDKQFQTYQSAGNIDARKYVFSDGQRHAVGFNGGIGISKAIDGNNVVINTEQFDYPSSLWVVDDGKGIIYRLQARMPIEEPVRIAESMK